MPTTFGDLAGAEDTVRALRQERLSGADTEGRVPTWGEMNERKRAEAKDAEARMAAQQAETQRVAEGLRFLVDVDTGEYEPVMPDDEDPKVGSREILVQIDPADPSDPTILDKGKRVKDMDLARLADPQQQPQTPSLRKGFTPSEKYAGIAAQLGLPSGGEE